ncbi:MAG TPA: hypothetical protein VFE42_18300 [Chloroflexota bacterium]|jgi:hypothetical protein|nr:hypothetical protein [Chloroflexota bacterium]
MSEDYSDALEMEDEAREEIGKAVVDAVTRSLDTGNFTPEQVNDITNAIRAATIAGLEAWMTLFYEVDDEDLDYDE